MDILTEDYNPEIMYETKELKHELSRALETIPAREATALIRRFGLDGSPPQIYKNIGAELGVSAGRIRTLCIQAQRRLRGQKESYQRLKVFLH